MSSQATHPSIMRRTWQATRWLMIALLMLVILGLSAPGWFRLVVFQPARDMLFFQREIQPWTNPAGIARHVPIPDDTILIPAAGSGEIDIELDLWMPEITPARAVLLLHGSSPRGRKLGFNMLLADRLREQGWFVLTPDARGFGRSGVPANIADLSAWLVLEDISRLVEFAMNHPASDGSLAAIGHSLGASQLLQSGVEDLPFSAVILIGPSRHTFDAPPTYWERARFSSDRRMARLVPLEVVTSTREQLDILRWAASPPDGAARRPLLLMDGEREGEKLVGFLSRAAVMLGPRASHVTVSDAHHYCGAYQLPWPMTTIHFRPETFDRCMAVITGFLDSVESNN
jgi:pimeloyl-ACP methyl ester carboxylesterase